MWRPVHCSDGFALLCGASADMCVAGRLLALSHEQYMCQLTCRWASAYGPCLRLEPGMLVCERFRGGGHTKATNRVECVTAASQKCWLWMSAMSCRYPTSMMIHIDGHRRCPAIIAATGRALTHGRVWSTAVKPIVGSLTSQRHQRTPTSTIPGPAGRV
jgi:hypothetical protein